MNRNVGFVCFGEVNTPYDRLEAKHAEALVTLAALGAKIADAGIVIDDPGYKTADAALKRLSGVDIDCLIVCVAGWIPSHAVIRVTDVYRRLPILLWGLCGWRSEGRIVTTAAQAGTSALRPAFDAMGYAFKYVYSVMDAPPPIGEINAFVRAAVAAAMLRKARIGTMGYRDMALYGTMYDGASLRAKLGVEVDHFEMLEMVRDIEAMDEAQVQQTVRFVKENWCFLKPCDDEIIRRGAQYALAIGKKVEENGWEAVSILDVDGMKKLLGFPPAMVFMLLDHYYGVQTIPENDIIGAVTQLVMKYITGETVPYLEYYEFFTDSVLMGVPDFIPKAAVDGDVMLLPTAFGLFSASLLNVSNVRTGYVTCVRLIYINGKYKLHMYAGEAKKPCSWEECGWDAPAPQLPSVEVFPHTCCVKEFSQKVSSQHVIVGFGDFTEAVRDFCRLLDIELI